MKIVSYYFISLIHFLILHILQEGDVITIVSIFVPPYDPQRGVICVGEGAADYYYNTR